MKKLARKVGRTKAACQFKFTANFEYIALTCNEGWEPDGLRITWVRGHRRSDSPLVKWLPKSDSGPVREGKATFDPPAAESLIVTLYEQKGGQEYDQKDYKFFLENEGPGGKKILASFTCNIADYAGVPSTRSPLDMTFKPVSKKITKAILGITIEAEFVKRGKASDDDMMSTFSRVSGNLEGEEDAVEDDDDDPTASSASLKHLPADNQTPSDSLVLANPDVPPDQNTPESPDQTASMSPPSDATASPELSVTFVPGPDLDEPCWLPNDLALIDAQNQPVPKSELDKADMIALYFSAQWCPPCRKFLPKLLKLYNFLKENDRSFELVYVSSDNSKDEMLLYMKNMQMPWVAIDFDSPLGEKLRSDFKVAAIPLLSIVASSGEIIAESAKKQADTASSGPAEMARLYNKWVRGLLQLKGLPVPEEEEAPEKKKGFLSSLFGGGKKKDKKQGLGDEASASFVQTADNDHADEAPPGSKSGGKDKAEDLLRQKQQIEKERTLERQVVQEKTRKLHVTLEMNAQMQKELGEKEERIRILEAKNETLKQTAEMKTEEVEELKMKVDMLEGELSTKLVEEQKLQDEKRELLANISLHGWLFKKGIKGLTANTWRRRYFRIEEGQKLTYYKTAGEGPPQGFIDIDKVLSVEPAPETQQDKNKCSFNIILEGRTFELQAHDEPTTKRWISSIEYMKQWREKQKREAKK